MFSLNDFQKVLFFKCNVSLKLTTENTISISNTCHSHTTLFLHKAATFCFLMPNPSSFGFCSYAQYILRLLFWYILLCVSPHTAFMHQICFLIKELGDCSASHNSLTIDWWFTRNCHFIKVNSSSSVWVPLVLRTGGTFVELPFVHIPLLVVSFPHLPVCSCGACFKTMCAIPFLSKHLIGAKIIIKYIII